MRYSYRAVDKHGVPVDFLLTAKRDRYAAKRFFRKALKDEPLLAPKKIGTDGGSVYPTAISESVRAGLMPSNPTHRVCEALPPAESRRLVERFEWHYTPKHGSWLDMAESELGILATQCLDRRIPDKQTLVPLNCQPARSRRG